ncbi:DUF1542 domain-containing protein [Staphylococcus aureus]|nr:DUF1542 domain-containing protein [Staphylococcus aureus]
MKKKQVALNQLANNEKRALQNINQAIANNDVKRVESNGIATLKGVNRTLWLNLKLKKP